MVNCQFFTRKQPVCDKNINCDITCDPTKFTERFVAVLCVTHVFVYFHVIQAVGSLTWLLAGMATMKNAVFFRTPLQ